MKIPAYWAKGCWSGLDRRGKEIRVEAWGWSGESREAARVRGEERARRACERLRRGDPGDGAGSYGYLDAPWREEVLQEVRVGNEVVAVLTRNRYGSIVLNAARVCFVDVRGEGGGVCGMSPGGVAGFAGGLVGPPCGGGSDARCHGLW